MATLSGKQTRKPVANLGPGRHGDGNELYLVVDPFGARRWIVRGSVKRQRNKEGGALRTDFGLGGQILYAVRRGETGRLSIAAWPSIGWTHASTRGRQHRRSKKWLDEMGGDNQRQLDRNRIWRPGCHRLEQGHRDVNRNAFDYRGTSRIRP